jgi:ABC-type sugar transport system permease subunit
MPKPLTRRWFTHLRVSVRRHAVAYLLISPVVLATVAFLYVPMAFSAYWSFTEYNGLAEPRWVGLQNYTDLLTSHRFQQAFGNTILFVAIGMAIGPALGLATALLLNTKVRLTGLFRTIYFIPVTTSLVVTATIWKMLLNQQGLLNTVLGFVGLPQHGWLTDPHTSLLGVAAASIWQGFGFETVIFLAALQSVPRELYEAAGVDGAGAWQRFWHVTLPGLRPTLIFVYVIGIIGSFQVFDQIFVMTQGGPIGSTTSVVYYLINRFQALDLGGASAAAYILVIVLAVLSYIQLRLSRERS